jgi:hypothetical protein
VDDPSKETIMNTEIEGLTLALLVVISLVFLLALGLRLAQQWRDRRLGRELDDELAHEAVLNRVWRAGLGPT